MAHCPFCGSKNLTHTFGRKSTIAATKCKHCGGIGPTVKYNQGEDLEQVISRCDSIYKKRYKGTSKREPSPDKPRQEACCIACGSTFLQSATGRRRKYCYECS